MNGTTKFVERDGVKLAYQVHGSGPGLLLTHGFGASKHMWEDNIDVLAKTHTVVTWDMRGHGDSDYPEPQEAYVPAQIIEDMKYLMSTLGFERFTPVGMSVGGYLALQFAITYPQTLEQLILVDCGPGFRDAEARDRWNRFAEEERASSFEKIGLETLQEDRSEFRRSVHRDATGLARAARGYLTQYDSRVIEALPDISVPTLVVVGENDQVFLKGCQYIAAKIPGAQLVVVPDAGHAANIDNAEYFNQHVTDFLAQQAENQG